MRTDGGRTAVAARAPLRLTLVCEWKTIGFIRFWGSGSMRTDGGRTAVAARAPLRLTLVCEWKTIGFIRFLGVGIYADGRRTDGGRSTGPT